VLEVVKNPIAYFAAMLVVLSAASLPPSAPTLMAAKANPPWLLALLASVAGGIAAVFDWYVVRRLFRIATLDRVRRHRLFDRAERMAKVAPFLTVVVFAALPLPFVIPRVLMPCSGYPVQRYAAAVMLGRFPRIYVIAAFGQAFDIPTWMLEAIFAAGVTVAVVTAILRRLGWIGGPPAGAAAEQPPPSVRPSDAPPAA
jgi:uncharacterized membrane protein YdjX (TVP38/TMEM64 family)